MGTNKYTTRKILALSVEKLFLFFLASGFAFLIIMFVVAGIFLFHGLYDLFIHHFAEEQVEKSLFDLIKGIEFIFIAAVPYLLMLSVLKYFRIMFPAELVQKDGLSNDPSYEAIQKTREEILFVRSLIVSIFIAVVITHLISHLLKAITHGQLDLPLAGVSVVLLLVLIIYYAQIEKALPPGINKKEPEKEKGK